MPSFDARTVVLVTFMASGLFSVVLFALHRTLAPKLAGLREGFWAALAWCAGAALIMARGAIPDLFSFLLGNMAVSGGILLLHSAIRRSTVDPQSPTTMPLLAAGACAACMAGIFALGTYSNFLSLATGFNALAFAACFAAACRARPMGFATGFTALMLGFAAIVSGMRFAIHLVENDAITQAFAPALIQRTYFASISFLILAILMGFTLITYERLNKILFATNAALETEVASRTADLTLEIARKQNLERLVASTAEAERRRIGNELHDDLGQRLTGISLVAEVLARELKRHSHIFSTHADTIQRAASDAIAQVRGLAHGLMPVGPEPQGFHDALARLADASCKEGLQCAFEYDEPVDLKNQDVATNLFRIAQEATTNALRHAHATTVTIRLDIVGGKVLLAVSDNGRGFHASPSHAEASNGRGLGIMGFRASLIHYRLDIESEPGRGTKVKAMEC